MDDQAARLRKLIIDKTGYTRPAGLGEEAYVPEDMPREETDARLIAVTSGKGGVGKTNFAVNLAIALGSAGQRVLIIDADLGMSNVDVILGTSSKYNLLNLLEKDVSLQDVIMQGPYGVNYISGGSGLEQMAELSLPQRQELMLKLSACGQMADIILIDTGAGIGRNVLDFILTADEVLLVTTPEPTALTDAYALMKIYSMYAQHKNIRMVVNRVYDEKDSYDVSNKLRRTAERFLGLPLSCLGYIYEDRSLQQAVKKQIPLLISYPDSMSAKCIMAIGNSILGSAHKRVKLGWKEFLRRFFDFSH